jgi:hypothetical protein
LIRDRASESLPGAVNARRDRRLGHVACSPGLAVEGLSGN